MKGEQELEEKLEGGKRVGDSIGRDTGMEDEKACDRLNQTA